MPKTPSVQFIATPNGWLLKVTKYLVGKVPEPRFAEVLVLIIDSNRKGRMVRSLLDTGRSKSIILKHFTEHKQRTKLPDEAKVTYKTYGGKFTSGSATSVGFCFVEFENNCDITVEHQFQVNKINPKKVKYNIIIGLDLLWNIRMDTYGGKFTSGLAASVGFRFVEFENNCDITVEHQFQVNKIQDPKKVKYDMVIGLDLLWNIRMDIHYYVEKVK